MSHYSENGDFIGTTTYRHGGRNHCQAITASGRTRSCTHENAAVAWLTTRYNSTH
jgi:hypothetical protein